VTKDFQTVEASKYYDEEVTVTGKVTQVTVRPTVAFLNLDQPGVNPPFMAVIFQDNLAALAICRN
jgi:hypothetical protein